MVALHSDLPLISAPRRILACYLAFGAIFGVLVPLLICSHYHIRYHPQDFYRMQRPGGDYVATYVAARSIWQGREIYKHYPDSIDWSATGPLSRYTYAPPQAFLFVPLSFLSFEHSHLAWVIITCILVFLSAVAFSRLFECPWYVVAAACLMYAMSTFLLFQFERGQTDALPLFCVAMAVYFHIRRKNPYLAGSFIALGATIKVIPGLFLLYFALRRDWRAVASTLISAAAIIGLTGMHDWYDWATHIAPAWSGLFLGYNVDHSLVYLLQAFTDDPVVARSGARVPSALLLANYVLMVLLNRRREQTAALEVTILAIVMEIITPWSANYKLVMLLFFFVSPFVIAQIDDIRRRPIARSLPLFVAFLMMVPMYGEYLARLPFSITARWLNQDIILSNPLDPIFTDRKVIVGILIGLTYLTALYWRETLRSRKEQPAIQPEADSHRCRRPLVPALWMALLPVAYAGVLYAWLSWTPTTRYRQAIDDFGPERRTNDNVAVAGYLVHNGGPNWYDVEIIYHTRRPMPHNLEIFLHARTRNEKGEVVSVTGRNFFPSLITSMWPRRKYVVARTGWYFGPGTFDVSVGFFDLSDGAVYGEANIGEIDFAAAADGKWLPRTASNAASTAGTPPSSSSAATTRAGSD
jgi:hypothetical protein